MYKNTYIHIYICIKTYLFASKHVGFETRNQIQYSQDLLVYLHDLHAYMYVCKSCR
jgi:hypothetical protein